MHQPHVIIPDNVEAILLNPQLKPEVSFALFEAVQRLYEVQAPGIPLRECAHSKFLFHQQLWSYCGPRNIPHDLHTAHSPHNDPEPPIGELLGVVFYQNGVEFSFVTTNWHLFVGSFNHPADVNPALVRIAKVVHAIHVI